MTANGAEHPANDALVNGGSHADKAVKLIGFNVALTDCARKLKETGAGAVGMMTFVLFPDGSCAFKPVGHITPGLCKVIANWGVEQLGGVIAGMQQERLASQIKQAVKPS